MVNKRILLLILTSASLISVAIAITAFSLSLSQKSKNEKAQSLQRSTSFGDDPSLQRSERQQEATDLNSSQNRIASAETTNWKTYTDQQHGYSVRYPPNWEYKVTQTYSSNKEYMPCFKEIGKQYWYEGNSEECAIIISVYPGNRSGIFSTEDLIKQWKESYPNLKIQHLKIDGTPAVRISVPGDSTSIEYRDNKYVVSSLGDDAIPGWEEVGEVISGMLTTFEFSE